MSNRVAYSFLVSLVFISAGLMLTDSGWLGATQGMTTPPAFSTHPGRWGLVIISSLQLSLSLGILKWGWSVKPLSLVTLALTPVLLGYFLFIREPDGREPITEWDQVVLIATALMLAGILVIKSLKKPGKTKVPYLLTGIWSAGLLVIQLVFHLTLIFPGTALETSRATQHKAAIQASQGGQNLQTLIDTQAVPLVSLKTTTPAQAGVARDNSVTTALDNIRQDRPQTVFIWDVDGIKDVDQIYVVYDGHTDQAWIAPASAYLEGRLMAMKGYMGGMALFVLVWTLGLLALNSLHTRQKESAPKRGRTTWSKAKID